MIALLQANIWAAKVVKISRNKHLRRFLCPKQAAAAAGAKKAVAFYKNCVYIYYAL
jgi:hypothetical protein